MSIFGQHVRGAAAVRTYVRNGSETLGYNQVLMWVKIDAYNWFMIDELGRGRQVEGFYGNDKSDTWEPDARSFDVYEYS